MGIIFRNRFTHMQVLPSTCALTATSCCLVPKSGAVCVAACDVAGAAGNLICAIMLRTRVRQVAGIESDQKITTFSYVSQQKLQRGCLLPCFLLPWAGMAALLP